MPDQVKRPYDSTGRRAAASERRQRILTAASALFTEQGYEATTVAAIAEGAGVALDTVYSSVGTKSVILTTLVELALSGTGEPVDAEQREYVKAIRSEPSAHRKLTIYAAAVRAIHERLAPIFLVLDAASKADPQVASLWQNVSERRARNMELFAVDLCGTGQVRKELTPADVADVLWATNAAEFFDLLVRRRGWSADRFERWLADAWHRLLLEP